MCFRATLTKRPCVSSLMCVNSRKERLNYMYVIIAPVDTMSKLVWGIRRGSAMGRYGDGIDLEKNVGEKTPMDGETIDL